MCVARRCAHVGACLRLRCVVGCSLAVPALCVLLPVVLQCCGVFCVLPGAVWRACVGLRSCSVLLPPVAVASSPVVTRGCVLSWVAVLRCSGVPPVVRSAAVCVASCWWCRVVSFALAGAVCCCLRLPAVRCWVWLPAVVLCWRVLSRVLLPGRVACCPAVCCRFLWCPAPLCCVLCSVVLCCRVVPCCGALLSLFLCWWCWLVSFPCVCGAVLRCALCCSVPVWFALLSVPLVVVCRCVLWCLPWRSVVWWCCSGVSWCLLCRAVFCGAASPCGAVVLCCAVCLPLLRVLFSFKNHFSVFEKKMKNNKNKIILYPTHACRQAAGPFRAHCLTCNPSAPTLMASSLLSFVFFPLFDLT